MVVQDVYDIILKICVWEWYDRIGKVTNFNKIFNIGIIEKVPLEYETTLGGVLERIWLNMSTSC